MKKLNILSVVLFVAVAGGICTSCADKLDLSPIDYYGSGSYWKTEAHVIGHSSIRFYGEKRAGGT